VVVKSGGHCLCDKVSDSDSIVGDICLKIPDNSSSRQWYGYQCGLAVNEGVLFDNSCYSLITRLVRRLPVEHRADGVNDAGNAKRRDKHCVSVCWPQDREIRLSPGSLGLRSRLSGPGASVRDAPDFVHQEVN
jgi:hypothetical protein